MYQFEILPQSWSKRRKITEEGRKVTDYRVLGFIKEHDHRCQLEVQFECGDIVMLDARVYVNKTHTIEEDGSLTCVETSWGIQGTNAQGVSVVLRLLQ